METLFKRQGQHQGLVETNWRRKSYSFAMGFKYILPKTEEHMLKIVKTRIGHDF